MNTAMKKTIQLTIVLFTVASMAMANDVLPSITLKNIPAEKKISLFIEGLNEEAKILLTDIDGQVLLSQETNGEKEFARVFNLNQLPRGEYFITVRTSLKEVVQPISLTGTEVLVNTEKKREFFTPVIRAEDDFVDVSLFNGRIGDVTINILDSNNEQVFQEKLENVLVVEKRYRLDKLPWGRYTIEVVTPSKSYRKPFEVR
ncbi:MAG: T9SS type A sorting domain-containing protein [Lewinellaceae bacterium]|nr:T9SS type A sorting domain-containing protein [Lewinellaceae bacterium]MCB9290945.1 T9SS type A sorting domain-containing protein [Lewinellaceae bacterium]